MIYQFNNIVFFMLVLIFLVYALVFVADVTNQSIKDYEKAAAYECGFQEFNVEIPNFEIKYYLVALLFLIFDIELIVLIPFISCFHVINSVHFFSFFFFYSTLFFALIFEWLKNYLDWN